MGALGYRYHFKFGLDLMARLGLGYSHTFHPDRVFKNVDGSFEEIQELGTPAGLGGLTFGIGYRLGQQPTSPVLSVRYRYSVELPISLLGAHQFVGVGIRFYPFQNKADNQILNQNALSQSFR